MTRLPLMYLDGTDRERSNATRKRATFSSLRPLVLDGDERSDAGPPPPLPET